MTGTDRERELPDWARSLGLAPHPEGGWFRETWRSEHELAAEALPDGYAGPRSAGTAIVFLLLPGEQSRWHTVRGAELWFHHRGGPVELTLGGDAAQPDTDSTLLLGTDLASGELPQGLVPPGHWQRARNIGTEPGLVSCVVVPGFDFDDFRLEA